MRNIVFTSDHAGYDLLRTLMRRMEEVVTMTDPNDAVHWFNLGPQDRDAVDYPDFAHAACEYLSDKPEHIGVFICGTGIGMAMVANRYPHVRCAVAVTPEMAEWTRKHNDANVLSLGARLVSEDAAVAILRTFLHTAFDGERHAKRVAKINRVKIDENALHSAA